jgi:hypothetical protein
MVAVLGFVMGFGSGGHIFVKEVCFVFRTKKKYSVSPLM